MIFTRDDETIIAQCTARGKGAIALLRLSGSNARIVANAIAHIPGNKDIAQLSSHTIHYGYVVDDNANYIDQVMFIIMDKPKTFTGQDTIEITCHNNPFIIEAIIKQAIKHGARMAQEGEFTRRAFLNGKIDLLQAEALNELIHANTQLALKKSLAQLKGSFSNWMQDIEKELIRALAWSEASFEFLDEEKDFANQIKSHIEKLLIKVLELKKTFDAQQHIRQGIKIAIIGSVNAGKSSLFNSLLNQKRSIVTNIAGTTRDTIEAGIYRNGNYWTLIDTAGLRQTNDIIEQEGIKKSFEQAILSDIIILVFDGSRDFTLHEYKIYKELIDTYQQKIILVQNKIDIQQQFNNSIDNINNKDIIKLSSQTKENISSLENAIDEKISALFSTIESPFLLNQRQYNLIIGLENKLNNILLLLNSMAVQYELISYHLKDALEYMSELTGKTISEAGMDMVFKEFCVGK